MEYLTARNTWSLLRKLPTHRVQPLSRKIHLCMKHPLLQLYFDLGQKIEQRFQKFSRKITNFKNSDNLINFLATLSANCFKNRLNLNKKLIRMIRRAQYLILGSKSNTVYRQIVPERACNIFEPFALKH